MTHKPHRGISAGTIVMSLVTAVVLVASGSILPKLLGETELRIDMGSALSALKLDAVAPALALNDIPITNATPEVQPSIPPVPESTAAPAATETETPRETATPAPTATPIPGGTVRLTIGGSVNIDDDLRKSAYYSDSGKYDFTDILAPLLNEFSGDLTLLTLENVTDAESKTSSLNAPECVMDMLESAGVDMLALGFPKAYDKGQDALNATIRAAKSHGMTVIGAFTSRDDAAQQRMQRVNNVDVAFLHYTQSISKNGASAIRKDGAVYALPTADPAAIAADIAALRANGADVVIVSIDWGKKDATAPTAAQKTLAQQLADAGADVIVGTGTRTVQTVEWLTARSNGASRKVLCAWSLGSLINGERNDRDVAGMLLQLTITFDGEEIAFDQVAYTPTFIWRYQMDGQHQYRVVASDQTPPDGMTDAHIGFMQKALRNIQKWLDGAAVTLR